MYCEAKLGAHLPGRQTAAVQSVPEGRPGHMGEEATRARPVPASAVRPASTLCAAGAPTVLTRTKRPLPLVSRNMALSKLGEQLALS